MEAFNTVDFNGESTFEIIQVLCFFRAFYEQLGVKFSPWVDDVLKRCWAELKCEHEDVCTPLEFGYLSQLINRNAGSCVLQRNPGLLREDHGECRTVL